MQNKGYEAAQLREYMNDLKKYPLLSKEEERVLAVKIAEGDDDARKRIINANLRLVVKIAWHCRRSDFELADLIQEGNMGLMDAVKHYDPDKNVRFATYACWWIRQYINRYMMDESQSIRLPINKMLLLWKVVGFMEQYAERHNRRPTIDEVAEELGVTRKSVLSVWDYHKQILSLDYGSDEDEPNGTIYDRLGDIRYQPDTEVQSKIMEKEIEAFTRCLNKREQDIIMYRFALKNREKLTLKKIGSKYGITAESVRQIEKRALNKLRARKEQVRYMVV